ncbi:MAG: hypothetical protein AAGC56_11370 [Pseudomonadota bacterium]
MDANAIVGGATAAATQADRLAGASDWLRSAGRVAAGALQAASDALGEGGFLDAMPGGRIVALLGLLVLALMMGGVAWRLLSLKSMAQSSLFTKLFVVVATSSAFFSAVSSAIGFGLITSQENADVLRNVLLPPAFGLFVFFLTVAIWVGGGELLRHRDWFRHLDGATGAEGFMADMLHFVERAVKLFIVIPVLGAILFFVSTWTSVVGIGGVDAVRYTYSNELNRVQTECAGIVAYRQKDFLFLDDLELSIRDVERVSRAERESGGQTGLRGRGAVSDYIDGVAAWLSQLEGTVRTIVDDNQAGDPETGYSPYDEAVCGTVVEGLKGKLSRNAFENYDRWAREFEVEFEDFRLTLNRWRQDRRIETFLDQQLNNFDRANPKPLLNPNSRTGAASAAVIERYAEEVTGALKSLIRKQRLRKPPEPLPSEAEKSPARGLGILFDAFTTEPVAVVEEKRRSRTLAVVQQESVAELSTMTPRDAVLKNFNIFSDVWVLALSWDYASYILLLAYLFFPSAERAAAYKDAAPIA